MGSTSPLSHRSIAWRMRTPPSRGVAGRPASGPAPTCGSTLSSASAATGRRLSASCLLALSRWPSNSSAVMAKTIWASTTVSALAARAGCITPCARPPPLPTCGSCARRPRKASDDDRISRPCPQRARLALHQSRTWLAVRLAASPVDAPPRRGDKAELTINVRRRISRGLRRLSTWRKRYRRPSTS
jgi:hypothetical protein